MYYSPSTVLAVDDRHVAFCEYNGSGVSNTPIGKPCFGYVDYTRYGVDRGCPGMRPR
jgi:hypothetical protein